MGTPPVILVGGGLGIRSRPVHNKSTIQCLSATRAYLGAPTLSEASLDTTSFLRDDRSEKRVFPTASAWTGWGNATGQFPLPRTGPSM